MVEVQIPIRFEGTLYREEFEQNETAKLADYRVEAVTKGGTYTFVDSLPYDFIIQNYMWRIIESFDGTISLGNESNPTKYLEDADFAPKTVGKKSKSASRMVDAGSKFVLYLGAGTIGKIELHVTGFLLRPSLL